MLSDSIGKWVLTLQLATRSKIVLLAILAYASWKSRSCYPGVQRLARDTGLSERSVRTSIADLLAVGVLELKQTGCKGDGKGRGRQANEYRIQVPESAIPANYQTYRQPLPESQSGPSGKSDGLTGKIRPDLPATVAAQDNHRKVTRNQDSFSYENARGRAGFGFKKSNRLPFDNIGLVEFARKNGLSEPRSGEVTAAYRDRLQAEMKAAG
jgi:hypothetical protein